MTEPDKPAEVAAEAAEPEVLAAVSEPEAEVLEPSSEPEAEVLEPSSEPEAEAEPEEDWKPVLAAPTEFWRTSPWGDLSRGWPNRETFDRLDAVQERWDQREQDAVEAMFFEVQYRANEMRGKHRRVESPVPVS